MASRKPTVKPRTTGSKRGSSSRQFSYDPATMRIVVLQGDDAYLMREYTNQIADALRREFDEIEEFSFEGESVRLAEVLDELRSYGLIQRHKLVILDNADEFLKESKDDETREAATSRTSHRPVMERYAEAPVDHATLLMRARTWRSGKIDKIIAKAGMIYKMEAVTEEDAVRWVIGRSRKRHEAEFAPDAAELLVLQIGADLSRLDAEIGKLAAYVGPGKPVTRAVVAELVGMTREEQVWAIQKAIASGRPAEVLLKLHELQPISSQKEVLISWSIMDLMKKVHAASRLLGAGNDAFSVSKELKLWGDSKDAVLGAARQLSPGKAAKLLDRALTTDRNNKSGVGVAIRSLETLMLEIADTIGRGTGSSRSTGSRRT